MADHNAELHKTEPEIYELLLSSRFRKCQLGDKEFEVSFCTNSPGAAGYCDREQGFIWISDFITDPHDVIEFALHEGMHAVFPEMSEDDVGKFSKQLGRLVCGVFEAKGGLPPKFEPLSSRPEWEKIPAKK